MAGEGALWEKHGSDIPSPMHVLLLEVEKEVPRLHKT
jgi:hypothetical protein